MKKIGSLLFVSLLIEAALAYHHHESYNNYHHHHHPQLNKLDTVYEWKYIDYLWDSVQQREAYIKNGQYDHEKIIPIDVDRARDGRIFVTTIRGEGVPASLAVVTNRRGPSGPLLKPYPDWSWYERGNCSGITNVYRIAIDECDKLYVLDTGRIGGEYVCQAQVLIFNLRTNTLVNRIRIPDNIAQNKKGVGALVTPVIVTEGRSCKLTKMFLADVNGYGLVIWSSNDRLFRLESKILEPEASHTNVTIAGESFELADSVIGLAFAPKVNGNAGGDLYFRPFSSRSLYVANVNGLNRRTRASRMAYRGKKNVLPSQASTMGISSDGVLFFGLTKELAIGCWNTRKDLSNEHFDIAVQDDNRLQFASGLKVIPASRTRGQEEVWILTNRFQKIMNGNMNFDEINFRIARDSVKNLIKGTKCESRKKKSCPWCFD